MKEAISFLQFLCEVVAFIWAVGIVGFFFVVLPIYKLAPWLERTFKL